MILLSKTNFSFREFVSLSAIAADTAIATVLTQREMEGYFQILYVSYYLHDRLKLELSFQVVGKI